MKTNEVKILLQKYYEGSTSPVEESDLEKYFLESPVSPEFEADRLHFQAVASMKNEELPVPDDLEISVLNALKKVQNVQVRENRRILYLGISVAAGLLLMVSTFIFISRQENTGYVTDPGIAYAESHEALELVSKYFNQGTSQLSGLSKINSAVKPLNQLNSLDKAARRLTELGKLPSPK